MKMNVIVMETVPSPPGVAAPQPSKRLPGFRVVARTVDKCRAEARRRLKDEGRTIRSLGVGPTGIIVYVQPVTAIQG